MRASKVRPSSHSGFGLPDFPHDVGVGVDGSDVGTPLHPEGHWYFLGHIKPPAVDTVGRITVTVGVHPAFGDGENVFPKRLGSKPVFIVLSEGGKFAESSPAVVLKGIPAADAEPVGEWGVLAILLHIDEGGVGGADVIEDAVDDDAEALGFGRAEELQEDFVAFGPRPRGWVGQVLFGNRLSKVRLPGAVVLIDVPEVGGVVFVMGAGLEDWIQIDRVHPQRLEVGELFLQALQVSAVMSIKDEVFVEGLAVFPFPRTGLVPREGPRTNGVMIVEG